LIANAVKAQLRGGACKTHLYTKTVDTLYMPSVFQPPKFQHFDRKGYPTQHMSLFIETYNNAGTDSDIMIKQFV